MFPIQTLIGLLFRKIYACYIPCSFHILILFLGMAILLNFGRTLDGEIQILLPCIPSYFGCHLKKM